MQAMKVEIRADKVIIEGYVNAVERRSRPFYHQVLGKIVEVVVPDAFKRAIARSKDIKVLLNHNETRELASTKSGTAKLYEDNVGLKAIVEITDPEVIDKARKGKLQGWSFGFTNAKHELRATETDAQERRLTDFVLHEVSIIDDRATPAYFGTSIETRSEDNEPVEIRTAESTDVETEDKTASGSEDKTTTDDVTNPDDKASEEAEKVLLEEQRQYLDNGLRRAGI